MIRYKDNIFCQIAGELIPIRYLTIDEKYIYYNHEHYQNKIPLKKSSFLKYLDEKETKEIINKFKKGNMNNG